MSTRSLEMFGKSHEGSVKFDYFICTVSGGLFAYIGQTYTPHRLDFSFSLLEPLSLAFLALSFFSGLKRIEIVNVSNSVNHRILDAGEKAGNVMEQIASGAPGPFYNADTGEHLSLADLELRHSTYLKFVSKMQSRLPALHKRGERFYNARNTLLLLGFSAIFLSKVLQPYESDPSPHKATPATQLLPASVNQTKATQ